MKIVYKENPMKSYVILSEEEKLELRNKLYRYHRYEWEESEEDSLEWTEHQYPYVLESLTSGETHMGDCTKVSCSCNKCYAEEIWGVNTAEGLVNYRYIVGAYHKTEDINQAIKNLETASTEYNEEWHQPHIKRWEAERLAARDSLIDYKDKHFP